MWGEFLWIRIGAAKTRGGKSKNMKRFLTRLILIAIFSFSGVFLFVRVFPSTFLIHDRHKAQAKAKATTLNLIKPSFEDFVDYRISQGQGGLSRNYPPYYEKLAEYMPQRFEAHAMLGFCYYYAGKSEEAIASLSRAMQLDPDYFWTPYNLGVIYFHQGRYQQAAAMLKRALSLKPEMTLKAIFSSKIYGEIIRSAKNFDYAVEQNLEKGYRDAYLLLSLIPDRFNKAHRATPEAALQRIIIQFF